MTLLTNRVLELLPDARLHREVESDHELIIYGPPGTGKSTSLLTLLEAHIKAGLEPDRMLVSAFTRNATMELKRRLREKYGLTESEMPWVRTIHSACYNLLSLRQEQVMNLPMLKDFGISSGYTFQGVLNVRSLDDPYAVGTISTFGDWCYVAEELRRATQRSVPEIVHALRRRNPTDREWGETEAEDFRSTYANWKRESGLVDFTDMLELVLRQRLRPPVRWMWLDEAQDMAPLQWRVAEFWALDCERIMVFADDDQSLFLFGGADPQELWRRPGHQFVLSHSYRLPSAVHAEALKIISQVSERVAKDFEPHTIGGEVRRGVFDWSEIPEREGSQLMLVRNRAFAEGLRSHLMQKGIPFYDRTSLSGVPDAESRRGKAVGIALDLHEGKVVRGARLRTLQQETYPDDWPEAKIEWNKAYGLVDLPALGATQHLVEVMRKTPLAGINMERHEREYLNRLLKRKTDVRRKPTLEVSTIHSVKGEEADHVVVSTAMTRRTLQEYRQDPDAEHRVMYVAATRARKTLTWVKDGAGYELPPKE